MRTSATLTTFKCNACSKEHTFAGKTPSIDARLAGWETETVILNLEVDLCPECVTEIKEFIHLDEAPEAPQRPDGYQEQFQPIPDHSLPEDCVLHEGVDGGTGRG